jgi:peptidyl-dipeptidase A
VAPQYASAKMKLKISILFWMTFTIDIISGQKFLAQYEIEVLNGTTTTTTTEKPGTGVKGEAEMKLYLQSLSPKMLEHCMAKEVALWARDTNWTSATNKEKYSQRASELTTLLSEAKVQLDKYKWKSFKSETLKKHAEAIYRSAPAMSEEKSKRFSKIIQDWLQERERVQEEMEKKLLEKEQKNKDKNSKNADSGDEDADAEIEAEADVTPAQLFQQSKKQWKILTSTLGKSAKVVFPDYMILFREDLETRDKMAEEEDKFLDQVKDSLKTIDNLWKELRPFYLQQHAYVRGQLSKLYGPNLVPMDSPIPINVIGEGWPSLHTDTLPYDGFPTTDDVTATLQSDLHNFTTEKIYRLTEEYFNSMDFPKLSDTFWDKSVFEVPEDGAGFMCDNTIHPFCYQNASRIIECDGIGFQTLQNAHSVLGMAKIFQMQRRMEYLPLVELDEVMLDAFSQLWFILGTSPKRLEALHLLDKGRKPGLQVEKNFKHLHALNILPIMANIISEQKIFWPILYGKIIPDDYNCEYWKGRNNIEGVKPPVKRKSKHFDALSLFDLGNEKKSGQFVKNVLTFQFYKALCNLRPRSHEGNHTKPKTHKAGDNAKTPGIRRPKDFPLAECDLTGNTRIGPTIQKLLDAGAGKDWKLTLKFLTGSDELDTGPMLEYFEPYLKWLTIYNKKHDFNVGWEIFPNKVSKNICV